MTESEKFAFGDGDPDHERGNPDCDGGRCGSYGFPKLCHCGGLIHAEFGDENADGDFWFHHLCDRCGGYGDGE